MKLGRFLLMILGIAIGALVVVWLVYYRRATLLSYSKGRSLHCRAAPDWIQLK